MKILGLVSDTHDSGIALLSDGVPELVLEEERFNRDKHTLNFPHLSLTAAFDERGIGIDGVDVITTPWNVKKLRRMAAWSLLRRFPFSLNLMHARAHRSQRNQIVILNRYLNRGLKTHFGDRALPPLVNVGHHDSHAAAFFVSPFDDALVLVMDGYGDDASSSAYIGQANRLQRVWSTGVLNSLGLVYTFATNHLGFHSFGDEGKVMALAAYGTNALADRFRQVIKLTAEGGYQIDMRYFSYDIYGEIRPTRPLFSEVFGPRRQSGEPLTDHHRDLARALQVVTEEVMLHIVRHLLQRHKQRNLVLTGGVALNCVANARILTETRIDRLWVPPCASDTGASLGSALWHHHQTLGARRTYELKSPYLGKAYGEHEIEAAMNKAGISYQHMSGRDLVSRVADDLSTGQIVGWYQGRFEIGPRALGNRSILADPRSIDMRDRINVRIKRREPFRPFAPAIPVERAAEFFEITQPDPFMTLAPRVRPEKRHLIAAAVHVDGTARIQTVDAAINPLYHAVLTEFGRLTGVPVLINTSFNEQEPIVASPAEAIACYQRTEIDVLAIGNFYVSTNAVARTRTGTREQREDNSASPQPARTGVTIS